MFHLNTNCLPWLKLQTPIKRVSTRQSTLQLTILYLQEILVDKKVNPYSDLQLILEAQAQPTKAFWCQTRIP